MELIFQKYYHRLCHFAWQMIGDRDAVEDVVQDAFVAFWKNMDAIADDEIVHKNFLYRTVRNSCLNVIRHGKVIEKHQASLSSEPDEDPQVINNMIRSEIMGEIYRIMATMPEGCRQIFRMGYLEGLSNEQISQALSISVNTVKTQKQRGLKIVRSKLHPEFYAVLFLLDGFSSI